jgi:hypothetical protein
MIKINMLDSVDPKQKSLQAQIAKFVNERRAKSYTDRNPHLGKMYKCAVCGNRHYSTKVCTPVYATHDKEGDPYFEDESPLIASQSTMKGVVGAASVAKRRFRPHRHPLTLELLQLTNLFFDIATLRSEIKGGLNQPDITRSVDKAADILRFKFRARRKRAQRQTDVSRRINAGLARPGTRP